MKYCKCKEPILCSWFDKGWCNICHICFKNIPTNKQIKASKQAKAQLRDSHGRFMADEWNYGSSTVGKITYKKQFYNASKKPCREQMDILRNHENRLKNIEKLLNEINVKL